MSLQFRIADQVLQVNDARETTEAVVHKYDAFLNLLCAEPYSFQRDSVRETLRFLVSEQVPGSRTTSARKLERPRGYPPAARARGCLPLQDAAA